MPAPRSPAKMHSAPVPADERAFDSTRPAVPSVGTGRKLLVLGDGENQAVVLPDQGQLRIGRGDDADIRIDRESVSRRHALVHVGSEVEIEDLGSSNGTQVGGTKLEPGVRARVKVGDVIEIGSVLLVLHGPARREDLMGAMRVPGAQAGARLDELVPRIARSDISVLLIGETGVGKDVMARKIHGLSPRHAAPLVSLNCGALPEALLESELFGHESGAFTGATTAKPGLLETAQGGTVFLDEIGELAAAAQVKLLRVLEDRRVLRVGGVQARPIDVRFVAATNRDLRVEIAAGRFREDLYYRLSGITLAIAPLRERLAELPPLAELFARDAAAKLGRTPPIIDGVALARLHAHAWPGNIRELRNVIERAVLLGDGVRIGPDDVVFEAVGPDANPLPDERSRIVAALQACAGNQTRAAAKLGISRKTLGIKMDAFGIPRPQKG